jgi:hypothetical protein
MDLTDREKIVFDLAEDGHGLGAIDGGSIGETSTVVKITGVDQKEVDTQVIGLLPHATSEGCEISPISTIVLFLQMASKPSMSVGLSIAQLVSFFLLLGKH